MRKSFLAIAGFFGLLSTQAQDMAPSHAALTLNEELKKGADVVYRLDEAVLNVLSASEYTMTVHQVVTLLNAEASSYLHHKLGTDKFYKVEDVDIKVYDALGLLQKKYEKKDFETEAAYDGFSLYTDDKVMTLYTPAPMYPCTIDVQYKIHATGYIELPNWFINYHKAATEVFRYEVNVPSSLDVRQRTLNMAVQPHIEENSNRKQYVWETRNVTAREVEGEGFELARYLPQVEVAPNEFSYDGHKGSFRTWQDFGLWNYQLYEEKAPFSDQRIAEIKELVAGAKTDGDKINLLYQYLQQNMRYVSIQYGIGGFKPFAVKFVDEKKYGDCKALTNYMRYLLKVVGINAYPALINAGSNKIPADPRFPSDPFNHVILCIPGGKDSTWLECTSTYASAGVLGTFTENKKALLLTEAGGILVNTPASRHHNNCVATRNEVMLNAEGGATISGKITGTGEMNTFYKYMTRLNADEQKETFVKTLHYKNPDELVVTSPTGGTGNALVVQRSYEKLYDFKAGNKYFFPLTVHHLVMEVPKAAKRETEFLFPYPYEKTDSTVFQLPAGMVPETASFDKELQSAFSVYHRAANYDKTTNRLTVVSSLTLMQHVIPADGYASVVQFFKAVAAAEDENLVLVKQ